MAVLLFLSLGCNLSCLYCFQRKTIPRPSPPPEKVDLEKVLASLDYLDRQFKSAWGRGISEVTLHGGEPTSVPVDLLEEVIRMLRSRGYRVSMQSNAYTITEYHLRIFKKYDVRVGVSLDGFPDINLLRGFFDEEGREIPDASRKYRQRVIENLQELVKRDLCGGVIVLLHRANCGSAERLERLKEFLKWLVDVGVTHARLNPMYANMEIMKQFELSNEELARVFIELYEYTKEVGLHASPFDDVRKALLGSKDLVCWFSGCHFYDSFVWAVDWRGRILSCDRTIGERFFLRPSQLPHTDMFRMQVRTLALLQTELKDDRYAHLHRGGCPCEALDGDWRKPSRFVPAFDKLFAYVEEKLRRELPEAKLASEYPNRLEYVRLIDSGRRYNIWRGEFE